MLINHPAPSRGALSLTFVASALTAAVGCGTTTTDQDPATKPDAGVTQPLTSAFALRDGLRELWVDHASATRVYLIAAIGDLPEADTAAGRLLNNQDAIGNAIKPFFGAAAGDALAALLHDHITIAAELVTAAKSGDNAGVADAKTRWEANGDQIAEFLADANPHWVLADLKMMMRMHLEQTLEEATARLSGAWGADVAAYDLIVDHLLAMADALSHGIERQFRDKVSSSSPYTAKGEDLHRAMRKLWMDHVTWTRTFLISAIAGLPDAAATTERLLQNQVDLGNAIKPFYGEAAGDALAALLRDHILVAAEIVTAAKAGDDAAFENANARWSTNGDQIATFLAGANPYWPESDLKAMMRMHLNQTLAVATARLTGDWPAEIAAADVVTTHILSMADALSDGIAKQFPDKLK